jgi:hypothetical protein
MGVALLIPTVVTASGSASAATPPDCVVTTTPYCLITEPDQGFDQIYQLINSATSSVDLTMYELSDPMAQGDLIAARQRGVDVRVVLDQAFSGQAVNQAAYDQLQAAGVSVRWAPSSIIYHQKTLTIDGAVSAIGTANLTAQYYASSRDFWVVDRNASDVAAVVQTFNTDWSTPPNATSISAGPSGADLIWSPGSQSTLVGLINGATTSLQVENEEMDSTAIESALEAAAQRGVSVTVTMTASSSWESAFTQLAAAGVQVRTYAANAPFYIHAKAILADYRAPTERLYLGSINFSTYSMQMNRELGLIVPDQSVIDSVHDALSTDFAGGAAYNAVPAGSGAASPFVSIAPTPDGAGYWLVGQGGQTTNLGSAGAFAPPAGGLSLNGPAVGIAATPDGAGYWLGAANGGVFTLGDAPFYGSMGGMPLNAPIVGTAATPDGGGYWLVGADGGIFAFGDAGYFGSMAGRALNAPIVGMATTADGGGYWLVGADGGIFAFGDASFFGSMGGQPLNGPVVGVASNSEGPGYWLVGADGGIFAFGGAPFLGSMGGQPLARPVVGMASNPESSGYWLVGADGGVFAFGTPGFLGSAV